MNIALILSGGTGNRMGTEIPKQYLEVNGKMIVCYSLNTLVLHEQIDAIQIVADHKWRKKIFTEMKKNPVFEKKWKGFSEPGKTRQWSIFNALKDIHQYADKDSFVMIHDAARPLLSEKLISDCFEAIEGYDGVMPVLPVKDTMYLQSEDGKYVEELLDRNRLAAGQAPEVFCLKKYLKANERLLPDRIDLINGSTEAAVLAGMKMALIPGDEKNFKITTMDDLDRFRQLM